MECEYSKYGCTTKLANTDHLQLHLQTVAHQHLKQVVVVLEKEIDKNKNLTITVEALQSKIAQMEKIKSTIDKSTFDKGTYEKNTVDKATVDKGNDAIEGRIKDIEAKLQLLQGLLEKTEVKQNGKGIEENKEDTQVKGAVSQNGRASDYKMPSSRYSFISGNRSTLERQEEKVKEEKVREERIKEEKAKEDRAKEEKIKEDKARAEKAKEDKAKEDKAKEEKAKEEKDREEQKAKEGMKKEEQVSTLERARSMSEDEVRRPVAAAATPPYIVKSAAGDIEPQERKHTSMSLREEPRSRSKTWSNTSNKKVEIPDIIKIPADAPVELGIIWEYDSINNEWSRGVCSFRMTKNYFAEGALRTAHMMETMGDIVSAENYAIEKSVSTNKTFKSNDVLPVMGLLGDRYVIKLSKTKVATDRYFEDVKMQQVCVELAKKFNERNPVKKVEFLTAWVLEIPKQGGSKWCGLEHYIGGDFKKQSNNHGGVLEPRNTPQAFSHFTWEFTKNNMIVVDLQGVDDDYTDPQIHTKDGNGYGVGNLGKTGIERFLKSHQCNAICQLLNLPRINSLDTRQANLKLIKGTQQVPFIDDQLGDLVYPRLEVGNDPAGGEFQCIQSLTGHSDRVISLCVTPKFLFSGSTDGSLRVWSTSTMTLEREVNVHRKSVESICANDQYLFTGSSDHSIKVWDINTFVLVIALRDHVGEVNAVALSDKSLNYLVSGSFDKNIKVWSLRTFKCVQTLTGHSKCVRALAISGSILFSGSNDGYVFMWSLKNLACLFALDAHTGWVKALTIKDKTLFTGSHDSKIKEWKVTSFQQGEVLTAHKENVNSLCITDQYLISGSDDKTAVLLDLHTQKTVGVLKGHRLGVQAVVTNGKHIFTGSDDCSIKVWKWFGEK